MAMKEKGEGSPVLSHAMANANVFDLAGHFYVNIRTGGERIKSLRVPRAINCYNRSASDDSVSGTYSKKMITRPNLCQRRKDWRGREYFLCLFLSLFSLFGPAIKYLKDRPDNKEKERKRRPQRVNPPTIIPFLFIFIKEVGGLLRVSGLKDWKFTGFLLIYEPVNCA